ncbi:prepilin-type N-terminal cleavage/methylation domain-containing protein [Coleofasciculus sp. FACHB-64]|uniref:hormogonium polysaccharide secretion pseudopilin HpsC n=1 Tax=Cyanophyceae TaxID=3028117 RepID=UPI0016857D3F|nr:MULTISPECIES: hormogonium polysaccharide secretion pseudopilin HpsC [unclassified Coleofasciculus]MBD1837606.1 prepilin-type N-terminal cleavage/methylation domain-containing protein [Coleofasciculus sp. FACHB-501]MBD2048171.1 prepilin-type N-terminal cleavage/methylation domain-containing protein [Coleofasciculus sp. FACHB-64]
MISPLEFILNTQLKLKRSHLGRKTGGFTLIELLVAMIMAALVITPLLGFMLNILETDRKEQAKANTEQEIQSALGYIAQDLQEAVYIYDANGVNAIKAQIPPLAGTPGCATGSSCTPVVVFWKREVKKGVVPVTGAAKNQSDDAVVYSLVAYYLIKTPDSTWSNKARIGRFQIEDRVKNPKNTVALASNSSAYIGSETAENKGFKMFDANLSGGITSIMTQWTKGADAYQAPTRILVDYIDSDSAIGTCQPTIDPTTGQSKTVTPIGINGFYACVVDPAQALAQVFIKGNATARFKPDATCDASKPGTSCPSASVQVKGRGSLGL